MPSSYKLKAINKCIRKKTEIREFIVNGYCITRAMYYVKMCVLVTFTVWKWYSIICLGRQYFLSSRSLLTGSNFVLSSLLSIILIHWGANPSVETIGRRWFITFMTHWWDSKYEYVDNCSYGFVKYDKLALIFA